VDAKIDVAPYNRPTDHGPMGRVTHIITVSGGDQPGLIARISEVFVEFGANVVHIEAALDPGPEPKGRYTTRFSVALLEENANKCLATVANTAESMDLQCQWDIINL
jgi:glycine cleavage system transcriptional repressor